MADRERERHERLLAGSAGYRRWIAERKEDNAGELDPLYLERAFAEWLLGGESDIEGWAGWTEDQFQAEWERWNS